MPRINVKAILLVAAASGMAAVPTMYAWGAPSTRYSPSVSTQLQRTAPGLSPDVLRIGIKAARCAERRELSNFRYFSVIDYSLPSTTKRLWIFDVVKGSLIAEEWVSHGKGSGDNYATEFSNIPGSLKSSLGLFATGEAYEGEHGYSLRLHGLDPGFNDSAYERAIVIHGADYVSDKFISQWHRLGRSWGCPAVSSEAASSLIDVLKQGSYLFAYYPDSTWLRTSTLLNGCE